MAVLALDIGGTNIKSALIVNGRVTKYTSRPTYAGKGRAEVISQIDAAVRELCSPSVTRIGISMAGPADYVRGVFTKPTSLPLDKFNIKEYLKRKYKVPVFCQNDARCFALGEAYYGTGKKAKNLVGITLGTSVGFGIVIGRKAYDGRGNAGELAHSIVNFDDGRPSVHDVLGTAFIIDGFPKRTPKDVFLLARHGNSKAKRRWEEFGRNLGVAIANTVHGLDPDIVVIGGNVANAFPFFRQSMQRELSARMVFPPCPITQSKLDHAILLGASVLE